MNQPPRKGSGGGSGVRTGLSRRPPGDVVPLRLDVPAKDSGDIADVVARGRRALDDGDVDAARAAVVSAAARAPDDRDVLLLKSLVCCADDDGDGAVAALDRAIAAYPDDVSLVATKAFVLLDVVGDPEGALPLLEEVLAFADEHAANSAEDEDDLAALVFEVSLRLVDAELATGNVDDAEEAARDALAIGEGFPEEPLARAALARVLLAGGDIDGARGEAERIGAGCDDAAAFVVKGRVLVAAGDEAGAAAAFARAKALDPAFVPPPKLTKAAFQAVVDAAIAAMPDPLRSYVKSAGLVVEERADLPRLLGDERSPETPLLLEGALRMPGSGDPFAHKPDAAVLYQRNVELLAEGSDDLKDVVTAVFVEVVGGFLGLEFEDDLAAFQELLDDDDDDDEIDDDDDDDDDGEGRR